MRARQLRRFLRKGRKFKCQKCPIPMETCDAMSKGLWGEEKCLLRVVLGEIFIFHCEDKKPSPMRGRPTEAAQEASRILASKIKQ